MSDLYTHLPIDAYLLMPMTPPVDWDDPDFGHGRVHTSPTGAWGDPDESEEED